MDAEKQLLSFAFRFPEYRLPKGSMLSVAKGLYYLERGYVRQYRKRGDDDVLYLHIFKPGSFFPLYSVYTELESGYFFDALSDITVREVPEKDAKQFLSQNKDIQEYLMGKLLMGMFGLLNRLESLVLDDAQTKVAYLFLYFARTFATKNGNTVTIDEPLSHKLMAQWIGTARETATLAAESLKRKGLIRYVNRRYSIPDISKLEREVERMRKG